MRKSRTREMMTKMTVLFELNPASLIGQFWVRLLQAKCGLEAGFMRAFGFRCRFATCIQQSADSRFHYAVERWFGDSNERWFLIYSFLLLNCLSVCLSVYLSVCRSVCVCLSVCLSVFVFLQTILTLLPLNKLLTNQPTDQRLNWLKEWEPRSQVWQPQPGNASFQCFCW